MTRLYWALAALLLAGLLGYGVSSCRRDQVQTAATQQADQSHGTATTQETQGAAHDQTAEAAKPALQADAAETARLRAEVARLRKALVAAAAAQTPGPDASQPVQAPVDLAPLVAKQDELIGALTTENDGYRTQNATLTAARDSWRAAAGSYKAEAEALRTVIEHTPRRFNRAAGLVYGTDRTAGAWVEYDLGRLRLGADVVRRPVDAGRTTLEASARIGWSF